MIGAFDSGHGGLTVLHTLRQHLGGRGFLYLGDHANAPYGDRTPDEIYALTIAGVERLFAEGCRLVILACNTASAIALRRLQQTWLPQRFPERRVLGVLVPMVEAITGVPWMADVARNSGGAGVTGTVRKVAIFATRRTVESDAYPREIGKRAPSVQVLQQACPDLARQIEQGADRALLRASVERYVGLALARNDGALPDAAMLGCTHYPLVQDLFRQALPDSIDLLSQPELVARSLTAYLQRHPEFDAPPANGTLRFLTTGDPALVAGVAARFFEAPVRFERA